MTNPPTWELLLAGVVALLVVLWFSPGIKAAMARSRGAKKDWQGVLIPLVAIVAFVFVLISLVK